MSGRVVHFEIPFDDGDRARSFYEAAFGWQLFEIPDMNYTLVTSGPSDDNGPTEPGFINGGMMKREEPYVAPNLVIDVTDIDETLKVITDAGGVIVSGRAAIGDMGFGASFRDTEGNLVGLWESPAEG